MIFFEKKVTVRLLYHKQICLTYFSNSQMFVLYVLITQIWCYWFSQAPSFLLWVAVSVDNVSDDHCTPPVKMSGRALTIELFRCRGVRHLRQSPTCFSVRRMFPHPLALKCECAGRWKERRGRMAAEEDETRGSVCFPRGCE